MAGQATVFESWRGGYADKSVARRGASWTTRYVRQVSAIEGLGALGSALLGYWARLDVIGRSSVGYLAISVVLPFVWLAMVRMSGANDIRFIGVGPDEFRRVLNGGVLLTAFIAIAAYAARSDLARGYVLVAMPTTTVISLLGRYVMRKRLHRARVRGEHMSRVVVVGHAPLVADIAAMLRRDTYHGLQVVAACFVDPAETGTITDIPSVGGIDDVPLVVRRFEADTVAVLACPEMAGARLRQLAWDLEKTGTDLCVAPALLDVAGPRTTIRAVAGLPLLHLDHPEFSGIRLVAKAAFDKTIALLGLFLLAPVLGLIALAIRLSDGGPAIFRQIRVGKNGLPFEVYKFRTMVPDAEARKAELAALNESQGPLFKIHADPRVTRIGGWLRRYSLDELPQLVNVLTGAMSLVGPRPALPEEAARYLDHVRRRLAVKPGITGLWQVNGRSDLNWDESVRLDLRYVENWSLMLDLQILWKTIAAVLRGSGAY
ncbi:MAG: sugar transferase [Streptosporangiaceae bacterium]